MSLFLKKLSILTVIQLIVVLTINAQNPAYSLFNEKGKKVKYEKMLKACEEADIILFGELHNNPISHWLQLELTQDLYQEKGTNLVLGAEMFEADNQLIMDEYFSGMISIKKFEEEMRLWPNYKTDYKPLLKFAKDSGLVFIATNVPRRYANVVFKLGLDTLNYLSDDAKRYIAPLPMVYDTSLNCYSSLAGGAPMAGHGSPKLRDAQALKDATMAHNILKNYNKGNLFLHYHGAYHSDNFESLNYFLKRDLQYLNIVNISTVSQDNISELSEDNEGKANFIIAVPANMTKTH